MRIAIYLLVLSFLFSFISCSEPYEPIDDAEVIVRLPSEPAKLSALYAAGRTDDARVASKIYLTLLEYDPETLEILPAAATERPKITAIEEGTYAGGSMHEYTLRKEATFSDGKRVTAADFESTIKSIVNPRAGFHFASLIDYLKDIKVDPTDPYKFTAYLESKNVGSEMAIGNMPIMPKHIHDPNGVLDKYSLEDLRNPAILADADSLALIELAEMNASDTYNRDSSLLVGSGAYELESWTSGSQIVLTRKENWWADHLQQENNALESRPRKLIYTFVKDEPAAITMLKDGQLDAMNTINPTAFQQLKENDLAQSTLNLYTPTVLSYYYMGMNMENPKLNDVKVRKALAHLVDYNGLIDNVLYGMGERIVGPLYPSHYAYNSDLVLPDYSVEKASELLQEAGWIDTNGNGTRDKVIDGELTELTLTALMTPSENSKNIGLFLKETLAKAGVDMIVDQRDHRSWLPKEVIPGNFDMWMLSWSQYPGEYDPKTLWHTASIQGGRNWARYGTTETDKVIDQVRNEVDRDKRIALYHQWQKDVVDAQPYIFLCAPTERIAVNKEFDAEISARRPGIFENQITTSDLIGAQ